MKITKILGLFGISLGIALFSYLSVGMADYGQPVPAILFGAIALLFTACFFGYLFEKKGWMAIGVNDFFDSVVDDDLVSSNSLHGHVIRTYWADDSSAWQEQVDNSLDGIKSKKSKRDKGNTKRFPIGTTANAEVDGQKFLFVALGKTKKADNVVNARAESLICAVRGMLKRARVVCSNEPLCIPLMGSGLARVGIKNAILVDLILAAIFEESQQSKVTDSITIILPNEKFSEINLGAIQRDWK